jgi:hypothetical protein
MAATIPAMIGWTEGYQGSLRTYQAQPTGRAGVPDRRIRSPGIHSRYPQPRGIRSHVSALRISCRAFIASRDSLLLLLQKRPTNPISCNA